MEKNGRARRSEKGLSVEMVFCVDSVQNASLRVSTVRVHQVHYSGVGTGGGGLGGCSPLKFLIELYLSL